MKIKLSDIRTDGGTQPRAGLNEQCVADYTESINNGSQFPPAVVFYDGETYWLADGFHRVAANKSCGAESMLCDVRTGTYQDARDYANSGEPNGKHGLRETKEDRHRRIANMLKDHPDWSLREVAKHCGVSHMTATRVRESICNNVTDTAAPITPPGQRTVRRGNSTYTMNTDNIGGNDKSPSDDIYSDEHKEWVRKQNEDHFRRRREEGHSIISSPPTAHVSNNSGNNEWYTPSQYIEAARKAMGSIDTDPASCEAANRTVKARQYFDEKSNGLDRQWNGNVWMNPPYAQPLIKQFCDKVSQAYADGEITAACVLVNNATETAWGQVLLKSSSAVCFLSGRVRFIDMHGNPSGAPLQGQMVVYLGSDTDSFAEQFSDMGVILHG